ncbi:MAG: single-stranded DNA-binding protein [Candidatus Latescibacteria bacterium]|nr:single-stranded DNA-binding protein [Candidatus Latescibacterota bacterium]
MAAYQTTYITNCRTNHWALKRLAGTLSANTLATRAANGLTHSSTFISQEESHADPTDAQHQPSRPQRPLGARPRLPLHGQRCRSLARAGRRQPQWQEETSFFDIVLWQKAAETLAKRLHKGTPVFITGRLQSHSWRDSDDQPRFRVQVQVRNLQILEKDEEDMQEEGVQEETALRVA